MAMKDRKNKNTDDIRLTDRVFDYVVEKIRSGELKSGMRLVQRDIASQLNTSQAPVREAFEKLIQKGWVEQRSGVYVKDYSNAEELKQLVEVRRALEAEAVRLLTERINKNGSLPFSMGK